MRSSFDMNGRSICTGDTVRCRVGTYPSVNYGDQRLVQGINEDGLLILINPMSPTGFSNYSPQNFERIYMGLRKRLEEYTQPFNKGHDMPKIHIATPIGEGEEYQTIVDRLESGGGMILAAASRAALLDKIRSQLAQNPHGSWLVIPGDDVVSQAPSPLSFRKLL